MNAIQGQINEIRGVWLLALAAGTSGVIPTAAQQMARPTPSPEAIAVAKELVAIMSPDMINDLNNKMVAQMWPAMEQALQPQFSKFDAATSAELSAELRAEFERLMVAEMTEFMETTPVLYARYLTVDEMRDFSLSTALRPAPRP